MPGVAPGPAAIDPATTSCGVMVSKRCSHMSSVVSPKEAPGFRPLVWFSSWRTVIGAKLSGKSPGR